MTRASILISLTIVLMCGRLSAQYAPQVPLPGNEGIIDTSSLFTDWASGCTLYRGWLDIADKSLGQPSIGNESDIYGPPGNGLISLGDSGVAVVTFKYSLFNGAGPDFAVFENAFANLINDTMAFLELAFVEVSSDGANFFRFPVSSQMQDTLQIDNFSFSDAKYYNNLAGKYISKYGTPFDLEELKGISGLDVDHITHIRIVDVVGTLNPQYASFDKDGRIINDPYPSVFPSGGFDLRGIGVINSNQPPLAINEPLNNLHLKIYPNPVTDLMHIVTASHKPLTFRLMDISGKEVLKGSVDSKGIDIDKQLPGLYLLYVSDGKEQNILKVSKQ